MLPGGKRRLTSAALPSGARRGPRSAGIKGDLPGALADITVAIGWAGRHDQPLPDRERGRWRAILDSLGYPPDSS
jgi:hypothetical protein